MHYQTVQRKSLTTGTTRPLSENIKREIGKKRRKQQGTRRSCRELVHSCIAQGT
jgi:hypothetical protein